MYGHMCIGAYFLIQMDVTLSSFNDESIDRTPTSKLLDPSYWLCSDDINEALTLIRKQWPEVKTQNAELIQRPNCFDQVVKQNMGIYAQVS